jgi:hypothetical protein
MTKIYLEDFYQFRHDLPISLGGLAQNPLYRNPLGDSLAFKSDVSLF